MRKNKMNGDVIKTAIIGLVILEIAALYFGINGQVFTAVVAVIAGLAGWIAPQLRVK